MEERRPPIVPTLAAAYRDFRRLLFPLRAIIISAFLIVLAISVVTGFVPDRLWDREISGTALGLVEDAIRALLLTPIVIAIHRFVILGEVTTGYGIDVGAPAFRLFFIWLFALKVLVGLPYELLACCRRAATRCGDHDCSSRRADCRDRGGAAAERAVSRHCGGDGRARPPRTRSPTQRGRRCGSLRSLSWPCCRGLPPSRLSSLCSGAACRSLARRRRWPLWWWAPSRRRRSFR